MFSKSRNDKTQNQVSMLAPAKLNLYLHVTGKRPDGYHLLDSLIVFTDICDEIEIEKSDKFSLKISGEFAHLVENNEQNIICRAIALMQKECGHTQNFAVKLVKNIPVGAGLGGGSADAAATLILINEIIKAGLSQERLCEIGLKLGADVPVFASRHAAYVSGIGEGLKQAEDLPEYYTVLVYPNKMLGTKEVFSSLSFPRESIVKNTKDSGIWIPAFAGMTKSERTAYFKNKINDLEPAAIKLLPEITDIIAELGKLEGCEFARMSGSGSTCFAIFLDKKQAEVNAEIMKSRYPDYWVKSCKITANY